MFLQTKKKEKSCETTGVAPRGPVRPRNGTECHEKEGKTQAKYGTKESLVAVTTTKISGLKIPPVGEKNKLLKAELAFPSITALAGVACTKQSSDLISPPSHRLLPYLGPELYQHTDRNMRWEQRTRESRRNGEQGQKGEAGNEKREGKGVHNNGKRSNLQILSRPTFPVQNDVQPRLEAKWVCRCLPFNRCPFLG